MSAQWCQIQLELPAKTKALISAILKSIISWTSTNIDSMVSCKTICIQLARSFPSSMPHMANPLNVKRSPRTSIMEEIQIDRNKTVASSSVVLIRSTNMRILNWISWWMILEFMFSMMLLLLTWGRLNRKSSRYVASILTRQNLFWIMIWEICTQVLIDSRYWMNALVMRMNTKSKRLHW